MSLFPLAFIALGSATPLVQASQEQEQEQEKANDIRLVVVLGVDQFVPEQLDRLAPFLTGGLGRFAHEGTVFAQAYLGHGGSETGPGYTTLGTGAHPRHHGIVANQWLGADGEGTYCMEDPASALVSASGQQQPGSGLSPKNVRVPALGDFLQRADPAALVVSIAGKDRAAIGLGGERPDACLWWGRDSGGFTSSTWYGDALPEWILPLSADWALRFDEGGDWANGWKLALPAGIELAGTAPDEREGEATRALSEGLLAAARQANGNARIAHLARYAFLTPLVDLLVVEAAHAAVTKLELGRDEHPDALLLGLSACDILGHTHGPDSAEVTDQLLQLDRALGHLFELLDEQVGEDRWLAVLTADHGVLPLPVAAQRLGIDARVYPDEVVKTTVEAVRARLEDELGSDFVIGASEEGVRLDAARIAEAGLELAAVRALAAEAARGSGEWLERAYTHEELAAGESSEDLWLALLANSFDAERSPDVAFLRKPWSLVGRGLGTNHGTPYPYDRHVALAFFGPGVERARRYDLVQTVDVVPTLLARLGIALPEGLDGRALLGR